MLETNSRKEKKCLPQVPHWTIHHSITKIGTSKFQYTDSQFPFYKISQAKKYNLTNMCIITSIAPTTTSSGMMKNYSKVTRIIYFMQ
jgi:hypothetical protein